MSIFFAMVIFSCTNTPTTPAINTHIFTPTPEATLGTSNDAREITNEQQAIEAAEQFLAGSRLDFKQEPVVKFVDQITLGEVLKLESIPTQEYQYNNPVDTIVWLVAFEGSAEIIPPVPQSATQTPLQTEALPVPRCTFVTIEAGQTGSVRSIEGKCPDHP
jgi:hypothetical protein